MNITLPSPFHSPPRINHPVKDPFTVQSDNPHQSLRFYHYEGPLAQRDLSDVFGHAVVEARSKDASASIGSQQLLYHSGHVQLVFYPRKYMTWKMWIDALQTIAMFVMEKSMAFGWSFSVILDGLGQVGHGTLVDTSDQKLGIISNS